MIVLDWRPWPVRRSQALWRNPGGGHSWTRPWDWTVDRIMAVRAGRRPPASGKPFIVSVGNLKLGGTGKTPVVAALAAQLAARGLAGAILTRGFGSKLTGPLLVRPENGEAGDEARLLAAGLASCHWPVVQARKREKGLALLRDRYPELDIIIAEDSHQTARLPRHLDVLILDQWRIDKTGTKEQVEPVTGSVFPFGPYRESACGAGRAGIWLLETDEAVPPGGENGALVATFYRRVHLIPARAGDSLPDRSLPWAALSGIARPESLENAVSGVLGSRPAVAIRCGDHAPYGPQLGGRIAQAVRNAGAGFLVTTAKDWVKLEKSWDGAVQVVLAELTIHWGQDRALPDLVEERLVAEEAGS